MKERETIVVRVSLGERFSGYFQLITAMEYRKERTIFYQILAKEQESCLEK